MKYFCLCMSAAIDVRVSLPSAPLGRDEIFKDVVDVESVGGKGVNVSRRLAQHGLRVACGGVLGLENVLPFEREFARFGIADRCVRVPGRTRRNEMFVWPGGSFKVNREAFPELTEADLPPLPDLLHLDELHSDDWVVLSGSLPKRFAPSFYARCIAECKRRGIVTVLDTSGAALRFGVEAGPFAVKPNAEECAALMGFVPKTGEDFRNVTELLRRTVEYPIVSDGANGCWFNGVHVAAPALQVVDTTGAGDFLLAEWCATRDPERAVRSASLALSKSSTPAPL